MARGNSKLYRVSKDQILVLPKDINDPRQMENAINKGYVFVTDKNFEEIRMITLNCSLTKIKIELVNVDVVIGNTVVKQYRNR
ncbi:hypothetical protein [Clostridium sp. HBUAS56017]|uniref:hypothetical protein n=1 Tax=Clostridium sp. HBUAS56017 TaxID=2571128 RepID=UPI001177EA42|nr:hypothetical protein [Clostridium sp. HBUAS56017]